jgi:PAS domain S-box
MEQLRYLEKMSSTTSFDKQFQPLDNKGKYLSERIQILESELNRLKEEFSKHGSTADTTERTSKSEAVKLVRPSLDLELQKQVVMLTEEMPHMVWIADSEGKCIHANDRFYEFTGITRGDDDGWSWVNVLHPEDLKESLERGNQASLDNVPFSMELRCRDRDGIYKWHLMHSIPFYDPDSQTTKWLGTTTYIDEQKQAQHQLQTLADAIPHIVFSASASGAINFWNHRWFEYSGLTLHQSNDNAWQLLIHPQDTDEYLSEWNKALKSGDTFEIEFRLKRAVGLNTKKNYLWHLARAVALRDSQGAIIRWFGTWTEIEGQKRSTL